MRVAQCWDDGVVDDVRLAGLLRKYGAKASFNLNFALHRGARFHSWNYQNRKPVWVLALQELKAVYKGFQIGNHGLSHPWLTKLPQPEMEKEIIEGKLRLEELFGQEVQGFVYPFGDLNAEVKDVVRRSGHRYARVTKACLNVFPPEDPFELKPSCKQGAPDFWERYQAVKELDADGEAVFWFWGHSYEFITEEDWALFEGKLEKIASDPDSSWVDIPDLWPH